MDGERGEVNQYEPILSPRQPEARMSRDLQNKIPVPTFIQQIRRSRLLNRHSAEHEWPRTESQALVPLLSSEPYLAAGLSHPQLPLRDDEFRHHHFQNGTGTRYWADSANRARRHTPSKCLLQPSPRVSAGSPARLREGLLLALERVRVRLLRLLH